MIVVLADSPFDFDTSAKVKINIISRECSPGPSKTQMIWAEESRAEMEQTGAVVKPRTEPRGPGSSPPVAVRCGLEQVTYPQLLR